MTLWGELKRRKVFQVAAVYGVTTWLLVQIAETVEGPLRLPEWFDTMIIVLLALGFPVTLIISWAFNLTSEGLVRDEARGSTLQSTGRTLEYVLIGLLAVAVVWVIYRIEFDVSSSIARTDASAAADAGSPEDTRQRLPNSVAVLPFASLSLDPEDAFFAEGIHDELLNQLARNRELNVISRTSVLQYAESDKPIADIAAELNVETVMEGTIRYSPERIRLTAQLIDPGTGTHLWSNTYERAFDVTNVFEIESDIATNIARELEAEFSPADRARIGGPATESTEAWALYLQAMSLITANLNPWESAETVRRFHALLDRAIEIDPSFARAHAVKAVQHAFSMLSQRPLSDPRTAADFEQLAMQSADRALGIDPNTSLAYMARGLAHLYARRGTAALDAFERALELEPDNLDILDDFARLNVFLGRPGEAIRQMRRIVELSPAQAGGLGWILFMTGNHDEAAEAYYEAFELTAPFDNSAIGLAMLEAARGNFEVAREYLELSESPALARPWGGGRPMVAAERIYAYGRIGDSERASRHFEQFQDLAQQYRVEDTYWALAYLGVGDTAQALERLQAAAEKPYDDGQFHQFALNIWHDPALETREFEAVRDRLGFRE